MGTKERGRKCLQLQNGKCSISPLRKLKSKVCQLWPLVMGISPPPRGSLHGSPTLRVGVCSHTPEHRCCGGMATWRDARDPQSRGFPGPGPEGRWFRISIFFFFFLPSCLQAGPGADPADTHWRGSFLRLPARPWRSPAESGRGRVALV